MFFILRFFFNDCLLPLFWLYHVTPCLLLASPVWPLLVIGESPHWLLAKQNLFIHQHDCYPLLCQAFSLGSIFYFWLVIVSFSCVRLPDLRNLAYQPVQERIVQRGWFGPVGRSSTIQQQEIFKLQLELRDLL